MALAMARLEPLAVCSLALALLVLAGAAPGSWAQRGEREPAPRGLYDELLGSVMSNKSPLGKPAEPSSAVAVYKEPDGWLLTVLKEFFADIDWQAIAKAREQIEKFIRKVDRILGSFRQNAWRAPNSKEPAPAQQQQVPLGAAPKSAATRDSQRGRWWWAGGGAPKSSAAAAAAADATNVKEMLERVACFVGYVRLMNFGNEALAELDASKVVTNLFGAGRRNSTASAWSWFG